MRIAIQGELGSFHDQATSVLFAGADYDILSCDSFRRVFQSIEQGLTDLGVVAVENSLFGSIHETYDQLVKTKFSVIGETSLQIHQNLITQPGVELSQITKVLSHPAALDQCRNFLETHLPHAQLVEHADTAGAVAETAKSSSKHLSAIASVAAAELHHMHIIASDIEDELDNITRFIVISPKPQQIKNANKASLILTTDHQPGALHQALGIFKQNQVNLTKLESRPIRCQAFRYRFIIDILANQDQLISTIHQLEQQNNEIKLLGHYIA